MADTKPNLSIKEKYELSDDQYRNLKLNIQNKNIIDPTKEQIEQSVNEVKKLVLKGGLAAKEGEMATDEMVLSESNVKRGEKSFIDYLPLVIGILFIVVVIYLFMLGDESISPSFQPLNLFGKPKYHISNAFGIVR